MVLAQKAEALAQLKQEGKLDLDAFTERLYQSLRKTEDYSECLIKGPNGLSVHRIVLDPYARILYSSKGEEFEAVKQYCDAGMSLEEAVAEVAKRLIAQGKF